MSVVATSSAATDPETKYKDLIGLWMLAVNYQLQLIVLRFLCRKTKVRKIVNELHFGRFLRDWLVFYWSSLS